MKKAKVLIVEDELIVAEDQKITLNTLGYDVVGIADTGERAIALAGEKTPDIILMDIMLAGKMDGITAASKIRAQYDIPVIYVTAYSDDKLIARATATEPFGYIIKPFNERAVRSNIEISLYRHRIEKELKKRDAILVGLGTGIEWFLRNLVLRRNRAATQPAPGRGGYGVILENIGSAMDLARIVVFRSDPGGSDTLSLETEWAAPNCAPIPRSGPATSLKPSLMGLGSRQEELRTGRAVTLGIEAFDAGVRDMFVSYRFRSLVVLDLQVLEQSYGLIVFVSDREREWPPEELEAMRIAANIVGTAIGLSATDG